MDAVIVVLIGLDEGTISTVAGASGSHSSWARGTRSSFLHLPPDIFILLQNR